MTREEKPRFDEIGHWSEIKLEIVRKYAAAYSKILTKNGFEHYYIDGFAGPGLHLSKRTGEWVPGSPLNALNVEPPFRHHFLIDLDGGRVRHLKQIVGARADVTVLEGDANSVLINDVFPRVRYQDRRRALCLLDPYGLQLHWDVMRAAGESRAVDLFLNFPIMDMNRNALWTTPDRADPEDTSRMSAFWGDVSWKTAVYTPSQQGSLFGDVALRKMPNDAVVTAFRERLRTVGGFRNVPLPLPMRNRTNAVVYYLFFASQYDVANHIVEDIFSKYRT